MIRPARVQFGNTTYNESFAPRDFSVRSSCDLVPFWDLIQNQEALYYAQHVDHGPARAWN